MTIEQQFEQARHLIKTGRYDEARAILHQIDHPTAQKWLVRLDQIAAGSQHAPAGGQAPPSAASHQAGPAARITFFCVDCGREAGPAILACPRRDRGACAYEAENGPVQPGGMKLSLSSCMTILSLPYLVAMSLVFFQLVVESFQSFRLLTLFFMVIVLLFWALGGAFALGGLSTLFANRQMVMQRRAGHLWERHTFWGYATYQVTIAGRERVPVDLALAQPLTLPASIGALRPEFVQQRVPVRGRQGVSEALDHSVYIVTMALLHLVVQDVITLWRIHAATGRHHKPVTNGSQYLLTRGPCMEQIAIKGDIEGRIAQAVSQWSAKMHVFDRPEIKPTAMQLGELFESREIDDMAYEIYRFMPLTTSYYDNMIRIALHDAINYELAVKKQPLRHMLGAKLTSAGVEAVQHDGAVLAQSYVRLRTQYPQMIQGIERQIRRGLVRRRPAID